MIKNKELIDSILYGMKDIFNFDGLIRTFRGRGVSQISCTYLSGYEFFETGQKGLIQEGESILLFRDKKQIVFHFKEEQAVYREVAPGKWKLLMYNDSYDWKNNETVIDLEELRKELQELFAEDGKKVS
jgi:hypothetical protein